MYFLQMLLAFLILCGVGLFFRSVLRVNMGEGMLLSASMIALLFFAGSSMGTFTYGLYGIIAVAVMGVILWGVKAVRKGRSELEAVCSPVMIAFILMYLFCLGAMYNDFIQHIDELHFWAAAVKYMLKHDRIPTGWDFIGGGGHYGFATSFFQLFFQKIAGYNEQSMYVAAFMFMWIGFLLPFSECGWKDWRKVACYSGIIYIALFSLYTYGSKSLYVDVPAAAWSGGLVGWWMNRKKKKSDLLVALSGLIMLPYIKESAGLLMAVFVVIFMLIHTFVIEKGRLEKENCMKTISKVTGVVCGLVILGSLAVLGLAASIQPYEEAGEQTESVVETEGQVEQQWMVAGIELPDQFSSTINTVKLSKEKVIKSSGAFVTKSFGTALASRSNWKIGFLPFVLLVLVLLKVSGDLYGQQKKCKCYMLYICFVVLSFSAVLLFSFLFMFAYELSVELRSVNRYFSICAIFLFVLVLCVLFQDNCRKNETRKYVLAGVALFFALGLNTNFIPNATALDKENISGFDKLDDAAKQVSQINSIIDENDKVYYIYQYSGSDLGSTELYNASALYHLDDQVSSYLAVPWNFKESGSNIRLEEFTTSIYDLPRLLVEGGYTYVWIYATNKYLTNELPQVLECDEVESKCLYRVVYEKGAAVGLEFVQNLGVVIE